MSHEERSTGIAARRRERATVVREYVGKVRAFTELTGRLERHQHGDPQLVEDLKVLGRDLRNLTQAAEQREQRLAKGDVKVGVVGLEKQGKSYFLSAWLGHRLLPSEPERCTWATTEIRTIPDGGFKAAVDFYTHEEFGARIGEYFSKLGFPVPTDWATLTPPRIEVMKREFNKTNGYEPTDDRASTSQQLAYKELLEVASTLKPITDNLGRPQFLINATGIEDLGNRIRPFIALNGGIVDGVPQRGVRAVKRVEVQVPVAGSVAGTVMIDLPGIDAPSDKARKDVEDALRDEVDVTLFVKDAQHPSFNNQELNLLESVRTADKSVQGRDRMFVVLTQVDVRTGLDGGRVSHWQLAYENCKQQGLDRIFPVSSKWALDKKVDTEHYVAAELQAHYKSATPVSGIEPLRDAMEHFLGVDFERVENEATQRIHDELVVVTKRVREIGERVARSIDPVGLRTQRQEVLDHLWNEQRSGQRAHGLFPEIRKAVHEFIRTEQDLQERERRAGVALANIKALRARSREWLTEESAREERLIFAPHLGAKLEEEVEFQLRVRLQESFLKEVQRLGSELESEAEKSVDKMLQRIFCTTYAGGSLESLLPGSHAAGELKILPRLSSLEQRDRSKVEVINRQRSELEMAASRITSTRGQFTRRRASAPPPCDSAPWAARASA